MSEWWTYRPSDFVMYSARTYARLVERYNAEIWPLQLLALALGLAILWLAAFRRREGSRWICALLAVAWAWIGWAFHWQRFSEINTAAPYFAIAFFVQALLLVALGVVWPGEYREPRPWVRWVGLGLLAAAVIGWPLVQVWMGRELAGVEVFGVMPGVTGVGTVGVVVAHADISRRSVLFTSLPAATVLVSQYQLLPV